MPPVSADLPEIPSDGELFERWKSGDRSALDALVDRHYLGLCRFLAMKVSDAHAVEELAHDTWVKVILNPDKFVPRYSFKTWLYTVARNTRLDFVKRERFRTGPSADLPPGGDTDGRLLPLKDLVEDPGDGPGDQAAHREQLQRLRDAMTELSDGEQELIFLKYSVGLTYKEIREVEARFDRPEGTLKYLMFQALKRLGARLADEEIPPRADAATGRKSRKD